MRTVPRQAPTAGRSSASAPPSGDAVEPAEPILLEYDSGGQVAILTLNRPHAGNGITTEMGKRMVEILRELAARPTVRCIIITGAGNEAFSVGSDLRLRNNMTNEVDAAA
jgi:enoyl-CoA hydratase